MFCFFPFIPAGLVDASSESLVLKGCGQKVQANYNFTPILPSLSFFPPLIPKKSAQSFQILESHPKKMLPPVHSHLSNDPLVLPLSSKIFLQKYAFPFLSVFQLENVYTKDVFTKIFLQRCLRRQIQYLFYSFENFIWLITPQFWSKCWNWSFSDNPPPQILAGCIVSL